MRRREFLGLVGGAAVTWPCPARAQQRVRRIGVLMNLLSTDTVAKARIGAFQLGLQQLGWTEGRNLQIDYRWTAGGGDDCAGMRRNWFALAPDAILATGSPPVVALQRATRTVPIVFVLVADPVGPDCRKPGATGAVMATGFTPFEYSTSAKWLELLKEIAPGVTRVAVLREATNLAASASLLGSSPRRHRTGCLCDPSMEARMPERSSARSQRSRVNRMAV